MSLSEGRRVRRGLAACAGAAMLMVGLLGAGCTVQPLYSNAPTDAATAPVAAQLASVSVKPVSTREALEVRNHLIFLLSGGQGNQGAGAYTLDLTVTSHSSAAAVARVSSTTQAPTSSLLNMTASYTLTET